MDPGCDEDHLAASARFKILGRGDSEKVKTTSQSLHSFKVELKVRVGIYRGSSRQTVQQ